MTYEPYTVVAVPFPFTDKNQVKRRPAIVLSSEQHQEQSHHITLLMITSAKHSQWESDYLLTNLSTTGLTAPSVVRQKIFTLDIRLVIKKLGKLALPDYKEVITRLKKHIYT